MKKASIFCSLQLGGWPPRTPQTLIFQELHGTVYKVFAQPAGFFNLEISDGERIDTYCFSRTIFNGPVSTLHLGLTCGDEGPRLFLNAKEIPVCANPFDARAMLVSTGVSTATRLPKLPPIIPTVPMHANEAERLFVRTVHELEKLSASTDWYTLLRASGPLRLLLLDKLLYKANVRVRHKPIIFTTNDFRHELPSSLPTPRSHWQNLSPEIAPTAKLLCLSLDEYLGAPILKLENGTATVKNVIKACANASGGVHFSAPRGQEETAIIQYDCGQAMVGLAPSSLALRSICQVTVRALHPVIVKIQAYCKVGP